MVLMVEIGGLYSLDCDIDEVVVGSFVMAGFVYIWMILDGGVFFDIGIVNFIVLEVGDYVLEVMNMSIGCVNVDIIIVVDNCVIFELVVSVINLGCMFDGIGSLSVDSVVGG